MDGGRSDGGGGQVEMEDEFACAGMLRGSLTSLHDAVERIFSVTFWIGADDLSHDSNGQIWLKLQGIPNNVKAAKLFVKGVVNQEEQQEMSYPTVLHCVFCGAKGLFMDCLIKSTSAHIMVGSPGSLLISGLTEPVVRAYSLITDLLERYEGTQFTPLETSDRGLDESLDSRRAFKTLVEKWEDKHILDLLVLPGSVKEVLLDLVRESGSNQTLAEGHVGWGSCGLRGAPDERRDKPSMITPPENSSITAAGAGGENVLPGTRGRAEGAEEGQTQSPQEVGEEEQVGAVASEGSEGGDEQESSLGNKEFDLLLKFFTAMGYTEDVVKRVLRQTGPQEASQILDLVQQEQDCSDRERRHQPGLTLSQIERNRPCETEHTHDEERARAAGGDEDVRRNGERLGATHPEREGVRGETEGGHDDDFVLGVLKKAAVSCGYEEHKVAEVYNMLPGRSTHQLLLQLQREESRDIDQPREGPRETDDLSPGQKTGPKEDAARNVQLFGPTDVPPLLVPAWYQRNPPANQYNAHPKQHPLRKPQTLSEVKGPPEPSYLSSPDPPFTDFQPSKTYGPKQTPNPTYTNSVKLRAPQPHVFTAPTPTRVKERPGFMSPSSVVVTGEQRFLEGLQTPFDLQLTDKPGNPKLRMIIIDGSNVAMSHGLGHFFSCRGIALAVQHFWDRGHRHISALLPQWRQKSDHKIKEQRYLSQLQELGLVSYTPSREFQGKRISSYDDRIMLQLAQSTDGVIVTNDNLRDLMDESPVWRDIIKKRLLQYTFVGDHFMVPDDPLGRGGPHLDDFLRSEHRTPDPGNHSFAGVATIYPSSRTPRSQTELLNLRDRTPPGGAVDGGGGRGKGRWHGKGWDTQRRKHAAEAFGAADRTAEETDGLKEQLCLVFPGQDNMVTLMLQRHPTETDVNVLSDLLLEAQKD